MLVWTFYFLQYSSYTILQFSFNFTIFMSYKSFVDDNQKHTVYIKFLFVIYLEVEGLFFHSTAVLSNNKKKRVLG